MEENSQSAEEKQVKEEQEKEERAKEEKEEQEEEKAKEEERKEEESQKEEQEQAKEEKPEQGEKQVKPKKEKSAIREIVEAVVIALVLTVAIRGLIVDIFRIPSPSMVPTIEVGDRVVVTRFSYWFDGPKRGDVVVFKYPNNEKVDYIKRVIGLPGETVAFWDNNLYINDTWVAEDYLPEGTITNDFGPIEVPENCYFMCGDNRQNSSDSRSWGFVDKRLLIGKGQLIYWPIGHIGGL